MISNCAVATFAIGENYQKYALSLFDSFFLYNAFNNIEFYIITDKPIPFRSNINPRIKIIYSSTTLYHEDVLLNKFQVKKYINAEQILLIDADSFICANLTPIFQHYKKSDIVIWGTLLEESEDWRGNSLKSIKGNKLDQLYKINGGVYLFGNTIATNNFLIFCNRLIADYDKQGFAKVYHTYKDDEIIFSTASAMLGFPIVSPDTNMKVETMYFSRRFINIFSGCAKFYQNNFERWQIKNELAINPMIICFDRISVNDFDYKFSCFLLDFCRYGQIVRIFVSLVSTLTLSIYYALKYLKWNLANIKNSSKSSS